MSYLLKIEQKFDEVNNSIKDVKDGTLLHAKAAAAEAVTLVDCYHSDIKKDIVGIKFSYQSMQTENVKLRKMLIIWRTTAVDQIL